MARCLLTNVHISMRPRQQSSKNGCLMYVLTIYTLPPFTHSPLLARRFFYLERTAATKLDLAIKGTVFGNKDPWIYLGARQGSPVTANCSCCPIRPQKVYHSSRSSFFVSPPPDLPGDGDRPRSGCCSFDWWFALHRLSASVSWPTASASTCGHGQESPLEHTPFKNGWHQRCLDMVCLASTS